MVHVKEHIGLLGKRATDRVTGFRGVVSSVCFDLYGCVQAAVTPGVDKDGKLKDGTWFDVARLELDPRKPVMEPPNFEFGPQAQGRQGPAEKPKFFKP